MKDCTHCWHISTKPILMVIPEGCVVWVCCKCHLTDVRHFNHYSIPECEIKWNGWVRQPKRLKVSPEDTREK